MTPEVQKAFPAFCVILIVSTIGLLFIHRGFGIGVGLGGGFVISALIETKRSYTLVDRKVLWKIGGLFLFCIGVGLILLHFYSYQWFVMTNVVGLVIAAYLLLRSTKKVDNKEQ